jgi:uncharacterized phage protein (TIGR01671 family)
MSYFKSQNDRFDSLKFSIPRMRAWHIKDKAMFLVVGWVTAEWHGDFLSTTESFKLWRDRDYLEWVVPHEVKVMRATGEFDLYEDEIFEGDIIEYRMQHCINGEWKPYGKTWRDVVAFDGGAWCVDDGGDKPLLASLTVREVVGNIYQNPEMLQ